MVPKVCDRFNEHLLSGSIERVVIAINSPLENLNPRDPRLRTMNSSVQGVPRKNFTLESPRALSALNGLAPTRSPGDIEDGLAHADRVGVAADEFREGDRLSRQLEGG